MFGEVFLDFVRSSLNPTFEGRHDVCAYCVIGKGLNSRRLLHTTKPIRTPLFPFWICDSEKRWEKGVYFLNFFVFGRKHHPFFWLEASLFPSLKPFQLRGAKAITAPPPMMPVMPRVQNLDIWSGRPGGEWKWHICLGCMLWIQVHKCE